MREKKGKELFQVFLDFWSRYETLFDIEVPLDELRRNLDLDRMKTFICDMFSLLESTSDKAERKYLMRNTMRNIIIDYSCLIDDEDLMTDCDEVLAHLPTIESYTRKDQQMWRIGFSIVESYRMEIKSSIKSIELRESVMRPIVFKLMCFYAGLAVSDRAGTEKCKNLAKRISVNWQKTTPESVTLSYLKKREGNSKLPINELNLLEKYSFWNKMEP